MEITGIVLAGGKSSRFGRDKGLSQYKGKQLISYSIDLLKQFTNTILISTNNEMYKNFGYGLVADKVKDIGPMGGVYSGLKQSGSEHNLFVPCDMPLVTKTVLSQLLEEAEGQQAVVVAINNTFTIPTLGYYHKSAIGTIENFIEKQHYKLQDLIKKLNAKHIIIEDGPILKNINTQEEL